MYMSLRISSENIGFRELSVPYDELPIPVVVKEACTFSLGITLAFSSGVTLARRLGAVLGFLGTVALNSRAGLFSASVVEVGNNPALERGSSAFFSSEELDSE